MTFCFCQQKRWVPLSFINVLHVIIIIHIIVSRHRRCTIYRLRLHHQSVVNKIISHVIYLVIVFVKLMSAILSSPWVMALNPSVRKSAVLSDKPSTCVPVDRTIYPRMSAAIYTRGELYPDREMFSNNIPVCYTKYDKILMLRYVQFIGLQSYDLQITFYTSLVEHVLNDEVILVCIQCAGLWYSRTKTHTCRHSTDRGIARFISRYIWTRTAKWKPVLICSSTFGTNTAIKGNIRAATPMLLKNGIYHAVCREFPAELIIINGEANGQRFENYGKACKKLAAPYMFR